MKQRAYRYRIYPTSEQAVMLAKTFGCVRFVYNRLLDENQKQYEETGKSKINTPAHLKAEKEWLKEVDALALCNAQLHLQSAFTSFFRNVKAGKKPGYPKYKAKHRSRKAYTTNNINNSIRIEDGKLRLPKVGLLSIVLHRYCRGRIKSVTLSQNASGHFYVSILTEEISENKTYVFRPTEKVVSIDMSFSECGVVSEEARTKFRRFYRQSEKKIAVASRQLSRKAKRSKNRVKARRRLAIVHEKVRNQRNDFLNKLSYELAEKYDVVVVEDINMQCMGRGRYNGKSVADIAFGALRNMLEYKLAERGKIMVKTPKYFPSTQLCSICGYKNESLKDVSIREYTCPSCGASHNRDVNACQNLLNWYENRCKNETTHATWESNACGDDVRPCALRTAIVAEAGKVAASSCKPLPSGRGS